MPKQARSNDLVSAILQAAVRVLEREGARRFTTARIAARAGISVGSLYQYFPNKAAILFRLQSDEWERTSRQWHAILADPDTPPPERLRRLVHAFLQSECDEAAVRGALADAAPMLRDKLEGQGAGTSAQGAMTAFMRHALPVSSDETRRLAADLIEATLTEVGESFSAEPRTPAEIGVYADAMADMFDAYLQRLAGPPSSRRRQALPATPPVTPADHSPRKARMAP